MKKPISLLLLSFLLLFCGNVVAAQSPEVIPLDAGLDSGDEPLPPDQAFKLSTQLIDADLVHAEWEIADGYYLYREKFKFSSETDGVELQPASFPKGKMKKDEFFGEVETYRHLVGVDIPLKRNGKNTKLDLLLVSQGCADIGICYPPQKHKVSLTLPPMPEIAAAPESSGALGALKQFGADLGLSNNNDDFLPVDKAFAFSAEVENGNILSANWEIAEGYYLYRDKFKFSLKNSDGIEIGQITMPPGVEKEDENFGKMIVYKHEANIALPLNRTDIKAKDIILVATYQGCAEKGLCYPPQTRDMPLSLPEGKASAVALSSAGGADSASGGASPSAGGDQEILSEQDEVVALLLKGNVIVTVLSFFGFGLLLAFTPCVFPMVPILSSIIIGQGSDVSTKKAFSMSLVYVLGMAITYTAAGVLVGMLGAEYNLQAAFQNPWILSSFAAIFVILSFSMFGFYDIQMPSFIQSRLTEISNRQQGGTMVGVGVMGILSALIVGPCVAAPMAGALIYIGQTGDAVLGGMALFALSLGMGAPLIAIGSSAGKLLPRAGRWMDSVKSVFGVLLLAVAIWMLERILPGEVSLILWALLLVISAVYMGALEPLKEAASGWLRLWKGVGAAFLIYGALLLIGASSGGTDPLAPLANLRIGSGGGSAGAETKKVSFQKIKGPDGLDQALKQASSQGKMALLDFYADWCISCKIMEKYTFSNPSVQAELQNVVLLQADVTENDAADQALMKRFGVTGPPAFIFFDSSGNEKRKYRILGEIDTDRFLAHLRRL